MRRKGHTTPEYVLFSNYCAVGVALVGQKVTHGRAFEATSADTWPQTWKSLDIRAALAVQRSSRIRVR